MKKMNYPVDAVGILKRIWLVSSSNVCSTQRGRDYRWSFALFVLFAAFIQRTHSYVTVSMNSLCRQKDFNSLSLSPSSSTSLLLDTSGSFRSACKMEIIAPETHSISLLYTRRKKTVERKKPEPLFSGERRTAQCMLTISIPLSGPDDQHKLRLDLCSKETFSASDINVFPSRVTLEWNPPVKSVDEILASEIVVAALGKGHDVCSQPDQMFCNPLKYPFYCISKDLVCDGKRNCPEGSDEDKDLCSPSTGKSSVTKSEAEASQIGHDWEFVASEVFKKLSSKDCSHLRKSDPPETDGPMSVWSDGESLESGESESLPDVLKHYGPWGYLMLGMLICGTVLMFCGLWECCCRKPKSSSATSPAGPTLLIINQGAQQGDVETPQTPGPPRYEDLDQPPSYAALFPSSKGLVSQTNILPIAIPIVESLSNLLTNTSSSQNPGDAQTENSTTTSAPMAGPMPDVFTIGIVRTDSSNCMESTSK